MNRNRAEVILLVGLAVMTLGMALVAFGVIATGLFFPGVYLLAIGLIATAGGAVLRLVTPRGPDTSR
jgi:hypothetical protein